MHLDHILPFVTHHRAYVAGWAIGLGGLWKLGQELLPRRTPAAVKALRGDRPRRYRGTHRSAPVEHLGATVDSPPLADLMPAEGHLPTADIVVPTIADVERDADRIAAERAEVEKAIADDAHEALSELPDLDAALSAFDARLAAVEAALAGDAPAWQWRHRNAVDERTGQFDTTELRRVLDMERVTA